MSDKKTATKGASQKSKAKTTKPVKSTVIRSSRLKWCIITSLKLLVILLFAVGLYVIYLDGKVRKTFEGQRWQVPVQVFGEIKVLALGDKFQLVTLVQSLKLSGYQKVAKVKQAGQFEQSDKKIFFIVVNLILVTDYYPR